MVIPNYIGPCAFGIKMGIILPESDLQDMILEQIQKADKDNLLEDGDVISVTESVVGRSQNNYVTVDEIAEEIREKFSLKPDQKLGVVFPIASRNRFSLILEGIAKAVPEGEVILQLSYPCDEVGNQVIRPELARELAEKNSGQIRIEDIKEDCVHPITGVNYIQYYSDIISEVGAKPTLYLSNDVFNVLDYNPDAVISADIHTREDNRKKLSEKINKCCTLQDLFNIDNGRSWSEFGLLGSNLSSGKKLKLAPYRANDFALSLQKTVSKKTGKMVEVIVSGDGAYKDPSSGIYELADPHPAFGATSGIDSLMRDGVKYKYLVDQYHESGKSEEEIESLLRKQMAQKGTEDRIEAEGTTPRQMKDVLASLADLVTGSADAGTPVVLIKGIFKKV